MNEENIQVIYDLLDRAKSEKQSKQREKRFRNYKDER